MEYGIVRKWDPIKGFGFINTTDDEDVFVNANDLDITLQKRGLRVGDRVAFDVKSNLKGPKAVRVRIAR